MIDVDGVVVAVVVAAVVVEAYVVVVIVVVVVEIVVVGEWGRGGLDLKVNQFIEVRPGIVVKDESGNIRCTPIYSRIVSLYAEQNELQFVVPGGLIGSSTHEHLLEH